MSRLSFSQLEQLATDAGFTDPVTAAAIAMAESGGNPSAALVVTQAQADAWNAAHPGGPKHYPEASYGLWQVNTLAWPRWTPAELVDPATAAAAALSIFNTPGRHGPLGFSPWSTFTSGAYKQYLPKVSGAPAAASSSSQPPPPSSSGECVASEDDETKP